MNSPASWYAMSAPANAETADVSVMDYIGNYGVNAQEFLAEFRALAPQKVNLYINSLGGSVFDAIAMFNGIRASGKNVRVVVLGLAASAASYLALVGESVEMPKNTMMMVHNPSSLVYGTADEMRLEAEILEKIGATVRATYQSRFKGTPEELTALFAKDTYLTAQECFDLGFCTKVTSEITASASFSLDRLPAQARAVFAKAAAPVAAAPAAPVAAAPAAPVAAAPAPLASQVRDLCAAAGLAEYGPYAAVHPRVVDSASAIARVAEMVEISATADLMGAADLKPAVLRRGDSRAEANAFFARVLADKEPVIDTSERLASRTPSPSTSVLALYQEMTTPRKAGFSK